MKTTVTSILVYIIILMNVIVLHARIPRAISYRGVLADTSGVTKPDGDYEFLFALYDSSIGGSLLWTDWMLPVLSITARSLRR